jgi:hypothetical protein
MLHGFIANRAPLLSDVQKLAGHLSFASVAVQPGRMMCRRIFSLLQYGTSLPAYSRGAAVHVRSSAGARADAAWWLVFLRDWNGTAFWHADPWPSEHTINIYTDASSLAAGAWYPPFDWFSDPSQGGCGNCICGRDLVSPVAGSTGHHLVRRAGNCRGVPELQFPLR